MFRTALQRGDVDGMLRSATPEFIAKFLLDLRRQSVATIGAHEAFVRRSATGEMQQVVRPVTLSLHDGTLFRIASAGKKMPVDPSTGQRITGEVKAWEAENRRRAQWVAQDGSVGPASLTYEGLQRCNEVVGATVINPPEVVVDDKRRVNPYVERTPAGDVKRIVVSVAVLAPSPATGNPVVVNYTLDYDPSKELSHALAKIADDEESTCYLTTHEEFAASRKARWAFQALFGGVGYAYDLSHPKVRRAYSDFISIVTYALRKAQTVALRNAMKRHPAFARHHVIVDDRGESRIAVIGWTGRQSSVDQIQQIAEDIANGDTRMMDRARNDAAEVISVEEVYEPEQDEEAAAADAGPVVADETTEDRNRLIEAVTEACKGLTPDQVSSLMIAPSDFGSASAETLRAVLTEINDLLGEVPSDTE